MRAPIRRPVPRRRWPALAVVALALVSCDLFGPGKGLAGEWGGLWPVADQEWLVTLDLTTDGDSIHGSAVIDAPLHDFALEYFVQGVRTADSVYIRLRPVEDADINFQGVLRVGRLEGEAWFNSAVESAQPITLTRR